MDRAIDSTIEKRTLKTRVMTCAVEARTPETGVMDCAIGCAIEKRTLKTRVMNCAVEARTLATRVMDSPYLDHVLRLRPAQIAQILFSGFLLVRLGSTIMTS